MQTFRNNLKVPVISSISCSRPLKKLSGKCQMFSRDYISSSFQASQTLRSTFTTWNVSESQVEIPPNHSKSFVGSVVSGGNCGSSVWRQSIWRIDCASILDESAEHGLAPDGSRSLSLFTGSLNQLCYIWFLLLVAAESFRFCQKAGANTHTDLAWNQLNLFLMSGVGNSRFNKHGVDYFASVFVYIVHNEWINQPRSSNTIQGLKK